MNTIVDQALERFRLAGAAIEKQRTRETDALKFQVPELQWPDEARQQRQGGTIGNVTLPARPMLSIPKLDQPIQLVLNAERSAHLGVQIHPLSEDADTDTAEMLQALYRRIEVDSRAGLARSWAFERAVKCGTGYYRILTEYDPSAPPGSEDQRIRIKRLLHQEAVYLDPFAEEPDWSDGEWGFIVQWMPFSRYKKQDWAKQRLRGEDDDERAAALCDFSDGDLNALSIQKPEWVTGDGEGRMILVAEYFAKNDDDSITWRKINAIEVLDEKPWPGKYIPIIPVIGRELIPFDTDRRFVGIIEPNKGAQQFFNYSASAVAESVGQEPKATWILAEGQEEGHEQEFLLANVRNFPYLRYKPTSVAGTPTPPPTRVQADTSKLGLGIQALAMASDFIHSGTSAYEPSLGQDSRNNKSGRQTQALQQQHEQANSNWLDNLAEISMQHEARVVLDLMLGDKLSGRVGIFDRPGRVVRTLDEEDNHDRVMVNQPFVRGPNGQLVSVPHPQLLPQGTTAEDVEHYDLMSGAQYAVTVSVGKAYKSRLEEGNDMLGQLFQAEPELFKVLGDIWLNFQSWPGHKAAADRIKKLLPPAVQDENEQNIAAQAQQMAQENAMLKQHLQELGGELAKDKLKAEAQIQVGKDRAIALLEKTRMDNEAKITVAELNALAKELQDTRALFMEERARLGTQVHDAGLTNAQHGHERDLAVLEHQQAMQQGRAQAQRQAVLAEQGQQHALEQGDQAQQGTLAAQQQAADLAPEPEAGA